MANLTKKISGKITRKVTAKIWMGIFLFLIPTAIYAIFPFGFWGTRTTALSTYPSSTGLVALWRLNESPASNGTALVDYVAARNATFSTGEGATNKSVVGQMGTGVTFDGSNDRGTVAGNAVFNRSTSQNYTMMMWVNRQGSWGGHCFLSFNNAASNDNYCALANTDSEIGFYDMGSGVSAVDVGTINIGDWHHYAVTVSGGTAANIYWDSELVLSTAVGNAAETNNSVYLAADNWGYYTPVKLDEVSYWSRALTAAEIETIFVNQISAGTSILISDLKVFNITTTSFDVSVRYYGDSDSDATLAFKYCNHTDSAGCDATAGTNVALTRSGNLFTGSVTGLGAPNNPGDFLNVAAIATDADGTSGTPLLDQMRILPSTPTLIYRSVAAGATTELTSGGGASSMSISGTAATFVNCLPNSVGVGDVIQYDSADAATPTTLAFISAVEDCNNMEVQSVTGGTPTAFAGGVNWSIYRAYTSLSNAEAGTENTGITAGIRNFDAGARDLVTNNERWYFALYANGTTADSTAVEVNGWTTDINRYIKIYTPTDGLVSQRHQGVWSTSYYHLTSGGAYVSTLLINDTNVHVEGLQIAHTLNGNNPGRYVLTFGTGSGGYSYASSNIITISGTGTRGNNDILTGINQMPTASNFHFNNNILYNGYWGLHRDTGGTNSNFYVYNNTFYGNNSGIIMDLTSAGCTATIKNNISYNNTSVDYDFGASTFTLSNNLSEDGSEATTTATLTFANTGSNDYHLNASDSAAIGTGADLSTPNIESDFKFSTDIDGAARPTGAWDIGADER